MLVGVYLTIFYDSDFLVNTSYVAVAAAIVGGGTYLTVAKRGADQWFGIAVLLLLATITGVVLIINLTTENGETNSFLLVLWAFAGLAAVVGAILRSGSLRQREEKQTDRSNLV